MHLTFNDIDIPLRIADGCDQYERSAPTVHTWLDDLYIRLGEDCDHVAVSELLLAVDLRTNDGIWMRPNTAANRVYKLLHRLGRDTVGMAGF